MITRKEQSVTIEAQNLDCFVSPDELDKIQRKLRGFIDELELLETFCDDKAHAMECRLRGDIEEAIRCEVCCEHIYAKLPEWAKWYQLSPPSPQLAAGGTVNPSPGREGRPTWREYDEKGKT